MGLLWTLGVVGQAWACEFTSKTGGQPYGLLSGPRDVDIDASGNAWVADTGQSRVQKFNSAGEFVTQFEVEGGILALDLDSEGDVWTVVGTTFEAKLIREYSPSGAVKSSFASKGNFFENGHFNEAHDLAVDSAGNIWVLNRGEKEGSTARAQKFNSKGEFLLKIGAEGAGNGEFASPEAIALDSEGNVLVADTGNNRYQEFNSAGEFVRKAGSEGTGNGQFKSPRGIGVDSEGRVWVVDSGNNRLQRFSAKGAYQTQFGTKGLNDGQLREPRGMAISGSSLWVADTGNDRVQKFDASGEFTSKFGGQPYGLLSGPRDVDIDASGNAWVADTGNDRVQKFNSAGEFVTQFEVEGGILALDLDSEGDVWTVVGEFPEAKLIREYSPSGEVKSSFASKESFGNGWFRYARDLAIDSSDNVWVVDAEVLGSAQKFNAKGEFLLKVTSGLNRPEAIALDSEGNILVADTGSHRYQEFNSAGEFVRKVGSEGTGNGQFKSPRGIDVDSEGRVWVVDSGNNRLQRFSAKGAYQTQFGTYGPNDGQLREPRGMAISGSSLWVADTGNERVQKFNLSACP